MGSGFSKMKKQARAMQQQYAQMREEMQKKQVVGTSGNGLVTITLNGERNLVKIKIQPDCVDKDDIEGLEDLICDAYQNAASQLEEEGGSDMGGAMGNLPF